MPNLLLKIWLSSFRCKQALMTPPAELPLSPKKTISLSNFSAEYLVPLFWECLSLWLKVSSCQTSLPTTQISNVSNLITKHQTLSSAHSSCVLSNCVRAHRHLSDPGCAEQQRNDNADLWNHQVSPTVIPSAVGLSGWLTFSPKSGRRI